IHPIGDGVSSFFRDVTARHRDAAAQAELLRREQAARRDSEEASRLKDEFVATVSHELRTPLNAILGWSRLLQQAHCDQAVVARALEAIERNASAQAQLVEDLLDIARITSGKLRLEVRPVTLGEVVEAAVETVRPSAAAKSIHIELDQAPGPILVSGDPDRLQQVVWNLLTNAVKFTSMGGRVQVQLRHAESHVLLSVCDTGIGIGPDLLPHVFERFRQAETGSARRHSGLGLGLALVRQLVELHGGTVSAESPGRGRGAIFTIALPRLAAAEAAALGPEVAHVTDPAAPQWTLPDLTGLPLLVVDDSEDARALMAQILERQGAIVSVAGSAAEALHVLEQAGPQVVLSDIEMPDRDGYWLVRRLRDHPDPHVRNVPAIAITAYARVQDRTRALLAGFHHHLAKPIDPAELVALVSRAAAGRVQT
ncbi:MAG TPA: ATP-binding protein, partial [Methylomirabilota bacterium]